MYFDYFGLAIVDVVFMCLFGLYDGLDWFVVIWCLLFWVWFWVWFGFEMGLFYLFTIYVCCLWVGVRLISIVGLVLSFCSELFWLCLCLTFLCFRLVILYVLLFCCEGCGWYVVWLRLSGYWWLWWLVVRFVSLLFVVCLAFDLRCVLIGDVWFWFVVCTVLVDICLRSLFFSGGLLVLFVLADSACLFVWVFG